MSETLGDELPKEMARVRELLPLTVREYRWCESAAEARLIEKTVHKALKALNASLYGEWFDIRAEQAVDLMENTALELGVKLGAGVPAGQDKMRADLEEMISLGQCRRDAIMYQGVHYRSEEIFDPVAGRRFRL